VLGGTSQHKKHDASFALDPTRMLRKAALNERCADEHVTSVNDQTTPQDGMNWLHQTGEHDVNTWSEINTAPRLDM